MLETIGKYRLKRVIGRGGMAVVYEAEMLGPAQFNKRVCLKKIRKDYSDVPELVKMFETEARLAATMQHTNVVQVFDFDRQQGDLYLAMEYVDGLDLNRVLSESESLGLQVPPGFAMHVLESLLAALDHAHTRRVDDKPTPIIHRDISPHNILITSDGVVKLADFGIAKAKGLATNATLTGVIKGKLCYMSPEQARGDDLGPPSDLFSAGLVFWEMLTGERFFKAENVREILAQVISFKSASIPHLSPKLNKFLRGILAPREEDRFKTAKEALLALKEAGVKSCDQERAALIVKQAKSRIEAAKVSQSQADPAVWEPPSQPTGGPTEIDPREPSNRALPLESPDDVSTGYLPPQTHTMPAPDRPQSLPKVAAAAMALSALLLVVVALLIADRFSEGGGPEPGSDQINAVVPLPQQQAVNQGGPVTQTGPPRAAAGAQAGREVAGRAITESPPVDPAAPGNSESKNESDTGLKAPAVKKLEPAPGATTTTSEPVKKEEKLKALPKKNRERRKREWPSRGSAKKSMSVKELEKKDPFGKRVELEMLE